MSHYLFPRTRFVDESGIFRQLLHMASEIIEIIKALLCGNLEHAIHEAYDLIGSTETLIRKIVKRAWTRGVPVNPTMIKIDVEKKNQSRGYYK